MKLGHLLALSVAFMGLVVAPAARADFSIQAGNIPQTDENVLLTSGVTGNTIFGETNTTNFDVKFTSAGQVLESPSSGQARIEADGTNVDLLGIDSISLVGGTFTSLILNLNDGSGMVTFDVFGVDGDGNAASIMQSFNIANGSNFFTITADDGFQITSVKFSTPGGIADARQFRIGGATAVPEPASLAMLGLGMGAVGMIRRRRAAKV